MNMALDEALLESAADAASRDANRADEATLRIYGWARPTLSLGYFQAAAERESHAASLDCDLIRRPSGGGAILHDRELTYALALPESLATTRPATQWYLDVHNALINAIRELTSAEALLCENPPKLPARDEPFLCFQRRAAGDVLLDGHKVAGSAQRRRRGAILQHGSVLLERSPHAPELPGIADLTEGNVGYESLTLAFTREVAKTMNLSLHEAVTSSEENEMAAELESTKYAGTAWTHRR